jgi:hypothetical protein
MSDNLSRDERSLLLYAETCAVDHSGLMEGIRMNAADHQALKSLKAGGYLDHGRIPASLLKEAGTRTHWVTLTQQGWALAHYLRQHHCAVRLSKLRQKVDELVKEKA